MASYKWVTREQSTATWREVGVPAPPRHQPEPTQREESGTRRPGRAEHLAASGSLLPPSEWANSPTSQDEMAGGGRGSRRRRPGLGRSKAQCRAHTRPSEGTCPPAGQAPAAGSTCGRRGSLGAVSADAPPPHTTTPASPLPGRLPVDPVLAASGCQGTSCCPRAWHQSCCSWQGPVS